MENTLKKRQDKLVKLLLTEPDKWFTKWEICAAIDGYNYNLDWKVHDRCAAITADRDAINERLDVHAIVVLKNNQYKVANEQEFNEFRNSLVRKLKNIVKRIKDIDAKHGIDCNYDLFEQEFIKIIEGR